MKVSTQKFEKLFSLLLKEHFGIDNCESIKDIISSFGGVETFYGFGQGDPYPDLDKLEDLDNNFSTYDGKTMKGQILEKKEVMDYLVFWFQKFKSEKWEKDFEKYKVYFKNKSPEKEPNDLLIDFLRQNFKGKHLYDKKRFFTKNSTSNATSNIYEPYKTAYLKSIGLDELNQLDDLPEENVKYQNRESKTSSVQNQEQPIGEPIFYKGYYYSFTDRKIKDFNLRIYYDEKLPKKESDYYDCYRVEEDGLHDNDFNTYEGYAYQLNHNIHIVLHGNIGDLGKPEKTKIVITCNQFAITDPRNCTTGIILSRKSGHANPVAVEAMFVKGILIDENVEPNATLKEIENVKRYLFLYRHNFRIKSEIPPIKELTARNVRTNNFIDLIGYWRVWRFNEKWEIVTSLLHVQDDYKTVCYTGQYSDEAENLQEQFCELNPAKSNKNIACFSTTSFNKTEIISYFMIECPGIENKFTSGVMILFPVDSRETNLMMRGIALVRENDIWASFFDEDGNVTDKNALREELKKKYDQNKLKEMARGNKKFKELRKYFKKINEKNGVYLPFENE